MLSVRWMIPTSSYFLTDRSSLFTLWGAQCQIVSGRGTLDSGHYSVCTHWQGEVKYARTHGDDDKWCSLELCKMFHLVSLKLYLALDSTAADALGLTHGPTAWIDSLHGRLPALVTIASPIFNLPCFRMYSSLSAWIAGPPAVLRASARPPQCWSLSLAALTVPSTTNVVRSAFHTQTLMLSDSLIDNLFTSSSLMTSEKILFLWKEQVRCVFH